MKNDFNEECRLITLETRRLRGDQIEVFKIMNGYENIDSNIFFEIKKPKITRGHNFTLVKKQSRLDVRKFSFSQRNTLSAECVHARGSALCSPVHMFPEPMFPGTDVPRFLYFNSRL